MIPVMVVPVLNRYDLLQRMLDSIDFPVADLLIIDNGGDVDKLRFPELCFELSHFAVACEPWGVGVVESRGEAVPSCGEVDFCIERCGVRAWCP